MTGVVQRDHAEGGSLSPRFRTRLNSIVDTWSSIQHAMDTHKVPKSETEIWYMVDKHWWDEFEKWGESASSSNQPTVPLSPPGGAGSASCSEKRASGAISRL